MSSNHHQYLISQVDPLIELAKDHYYKLVLILGGKWKERTSFLKALAKKNNLDYISLGLPLSQAMLNRAPRERPLIVEDYVTTLLSAGLTSGFILDHIEILFNPTLFTDPMRLLQSISRSRVIVASWPGTYDGNRVSYSKPSDDEYFSIKINDLLPYSIKVN